MGTQIHHRHWLDCLEIRPQISEEKPILERRGGEREIEGEKQEPILERRRFELIPNVDPNMTWASFRIQVTDELIFQDRGYMRVTREGPGSPHVGFSMGEKTKFPEYFCMVMCSALCRHEVVGDTASRMVYDLFWQGLHTDEDFRAWIAEHAPRWWKLVEDQVLRQSQAQ